MRKALCVATLVAGSIIPRAAIAAEPLGRLFFSPAQRTILDAGKNLATPTKVSPAPRTIHLSGVVTRSDAENTVWINGTAYHNASPDGVQVQTDRAAPASTAIRIPGRSTKSRVKVGQRLDMNSGQIREDFSHQTAAAENAAVPTESPGDRSIAERKSKSTDIKSPVTGDKSGNPATIAR